MPIDLRSDTVTRPTRAMRAAMADAEVGDDVLDGDPTVRRLEDRCAELLGMDWAVYVPTGTMGNMIAVQLGSRPGTEILLDAGAHILHYEIAGAALLSAVQVRPVTPTGLVMNAADLQRTMRPPSPHVPRASLVCLENTHNGAGGVITPLAEMQAMRQVADAHGLPLHLDGARLWNAHIATGLPLATLASVADTVMCSFSKGLGAPMGAIVAGRRGTRADAWEARKRLGGGMRQSGILAAAALHGLDHHVTRLAEDHAHARRLAEIVDGAGGAKVVPPDTNIVMVDLPGPKAADVAAAAKARGLLVSQWSPTRVRLVTHLDADLAAVEMAGRLLVEVLTA